MSRVLLFTVIAVVCFCVIVNIAPVFAGSRTNLEPQIMAPGVISTRDYERDGTFTPDGKTFFYTKRTIWSYFSAICVSYLKNGRWSEPEVAPFSGQYSDAMPFISPDGARLYFASRRPIDPTSGSAAKRDYDIWFVERTASGWGDPQHLPAPINTSGSELSPVVTRDGSIYFLNNASPNMMYAAKKGDGWTDPVAVGAPNEAGSFDLGGYVDPDERYMIVAVIGRSDALHSAEGIYPRADLYVRERINGAWSDLRHLDAPINSAADDITPSVTPDGKYLIFTSERGVFTEHGTRRLTFDEFENGLHNIGNGLGDIYKVDLRALGGRFANGSAANSNSSPLTPNRHPTGNKEPSLPPRSITSQTSNVPQILGDGIFSTSDDEFGGAFTPDGKTLYFTRSAPHSYRYVILESHLRDGKWTTPVVAPFSGQYTDSDPVLSPDGSKLFWSSDRPVDGKVKHDYDIWMVDRTASGGWSEPIHLPAPINSDASEFFASITAGGTLYFSSARDGGDTGAIRAYRSHFANGVWGPAENVSKMIDGQDAKAYYDLDVMIAPDESYLLISSLARPDGFGHYDLYLAWRHADGSWSKLIHLPAPFNTSARDYSPHLSPDGKRLYFSSERGFALGPIAKPMTYHELIERFRGTLNGSGNLYEIDLSALDQFREH